VPIYLLIVETLTNIKHGPREPLAEICRRLHADRQAQVLPVRPSTNDRLFVLTLSLYQETWTFFFSFEGARNARRPLLVGSPPVRKEGGIIEKCWRWWL